MDFKEWLNSVISSGNLCNEYKDKALNAQSHLSLMRLVLDSNGSTYLCEMASKGFMLPYEVICTKFNNYINGKYIAEYRNEKGSGYSSCIYCCFSAIPGVRIQTTITTFLGCKTNVWVEENDFVKLVADSNCELFINIPDSSRCIVECWGNARIHIQGNSNNVTINKHE